MSYCLNPDCQSPQNRAKAEVCQFCGAKLLLKERYRAIAVIGQGGFGRTFLAIDTDKPSKPRCVIKQFLPTAKGTSQQQKAADLFEQEAVRLEELGTHPQIPSLLAHFSQAQQQYLVQEYIDGKNLAEALEAQGAFTEAQIREVLTSLLPVLDFIHARQVIHRDIKPANVIALPGSRILAGACPSDRPDWSGWLQLLARETSQGFRDHGNASQRFGERLSHSLAQASERFAIADYRRCQEIATQFAHYDRLGFSQRQYLVADASRVLYELRRRYDRPDSTAQANLVLVDFGAAKTARGEFSQTGTTIGSPGFTAPEQARGKASFASDLYSLGVTCIHLLTQASPFDLFNTNEDDWVWQQFLDAPLSDRLTQILNRLIEPGVKRRYTSAADVLRDLHPKPIAVPLSVPMPPAAFVQPAALRIAAIQTVPNAETTELPASPTGRSPRRSSRTQRWQCVQQFASPSRVFAIALSPIDALLASSSGTTIKLWDLQTGQLSRALTGHLDIIPALAVSPNGKRLVSGSADKSLKLWDLPSGHRVGSLTRHTDTVLAVAIAPDGRTLASSSFYDPIVLWDLDTGQERDRLYGHLSRVDALTFSPDGKTLVSGSDDRHIKLWDLATGKARSLVGHSDRITSLAVSPDGKTLASGSWDGTIKLWSTSTRRLKRTLTLESRVTAIAFAPDGKTLITGSDSLQVWNVRTGKLVDTLTQPVQEIEAISALPTTVPTAEFASANRDGNIQLWQFSSP